MAGIPLKSGADFYNLEASRMRLHNLGADPTEVGTGLIYFNTSTGMNTSGRARLYTGNGFRSLAFMDDVDAINEKLNMVLGEVDLDGIIENMNEVIKFLEDNKDTENLMDLLNSKANAGIEGGKGYVAFPYTNDKQAFIFYNGGFEWSLTNEGWTGSHKILHSGNYSNYALPLSGGTIKGDIQARSYIFGTYGDVAWGKLVIDDSVNNRIYYVDKAGTYNTLLHSGNIGEYNAGGIVNLGSPTTDTFADYIAKYAKGANVVINESGAAVGNIGKYDSVLNVGTWSGRFGRFAFSVGTNPTLCFQTGNDSGNGWGNKKTIAFTDSNVASAQALVHSNGTVGAIVNSSGNVTIGDTEPKAKLSINTGGASALPELGALATSQTIEIGNAGKYGTYIGSLGSGVGFIQQGRADASAKSYNLLLNPLGGNVLIGTTEDNGAKLQVAGTTASVISLKRTTTGGSFIDYFKNNESNNQWRVGHDHGSNGSSFRFNKFSGTTENTVMSILENGNVLIGTTTEDGTSAKLQINGSATITAMGANTEILRFRTDRAWAFYQVGSGAGASLQLRALSSGKSFSIGRDDGSQVFSVNTAASGAVVTSDASIFPLSSNTHRLGAFDSRWSWLYAVNGNFSGNIEATGFISTRDRLEVYGSQPYIDFHHNNTTDDYSVRLIEQTRGTLKLVGDLHVTGNIIADKEVSAGGAAEESGEGGGGTGGGVEPYVFTFTPSTTTVSVNHNISSEDVIVQVYEKDATSGKWSVILVDIEIVDSTRVDLHFGRTETTEHKVVIIG